jgi:hypothetical protein
VLEPEATAERRNELLIEAKTQVRLPVQYFDVTFSVSKSITVLHASAMASAARAEASRDPKAARVLAAGRRRPACIEQGNQAALDYLQREAGYTPIRLPRPPGRRRPLRLVGRRPRVHRRQLPPAHLP